MISMFQTRLLQIFQLFHILQSLESGHVVGGGHEDGYAHFCAPD
jgi:hypothetical protein